MNLRVWAKALRKYWWIVLTTAVLGTALGAIATLLVRPQYASSITFFVRTPADQIGGAYQGDQFAQKRVNSYVQLMESQRLAAMVLDDIKIEITPSELASEISAKGDLNTVLLTATVVDQSPERSLRIAQSLSSQFVALVSTIETPPGSTTPAVTLEVTSAATLNPEPVVPRPLVNLAAGLVGGLMIGAALAGLREVLDTTVRTAAAVQELTGKPTLAQIPFDRVAEPSPLIDFTNTRSIRAESFRQLRTNLQFLRVENAVEVVAVTSSVAAEGKSTTAANLAISFADAGKTTLLIECDLRRPRLAEYLGLEGSVGLTNVLAGQLTVNEALQPWGRDSLVVLPSGSIPPNPAELLGGRRMRDLVTSLRGRFELIILDTPPLLAVTDAAIAATYSDGAILVVRHGTTRRNQVAGAVSALEAVGATLLGTVVNRAPTKGADVYVHQAYGYYAMDNNTSRPAGEVKTTDPSVHSMPAQDDPTAPQGPQDDPTAPQGHSASDNDSASSTPALPGHLETKVINSRRRFDEFL